MAYHLCSSPSSLCHDHHYLHNSLSFSRKSRLRSFNSFSFKPNSLTSLKNLSPNHPCLFRGPNSTRNPEGDASNPPNCQDPDRKTKSYIWVNPRSPRASKLRQHSYDARYASLVKIAESLDSCEATEEDVSQVLRCLGDKILEQDAVIVLNNMTNPETALLAFGFVRKRLKPSREELG
ncbi:hypothetical protein AAG906_015109 [Vitis piasezkii]